MSHCHVWLPESSEVALLVEVVLVVVLVVPGASLFRTAAPDLCYLTAVPKLPTRQWPKISSHIYICVYIIYIDIYTYIWHIYIYIIILYIHTLTMKWIYIYIRYHMVSYYICHVYASKPGGRTFHKSPLFGTSISTSQQRPDVRFASTLARSSSDQPGNKADGFFKSKYDHFIMPLPRDQ